METIQQKIEAIRKEKGIKQSVIAEKLGVGQSTYSLYFTRNMDMKWNLILRIAYILGVSIVDLVTYPVKYVPLDEKPKECSECRKKDLIIENLNNYIEILKKQHQ